MIENKITPGTPDGICLQCAQCYDNECRAYEMPHSREEYEARAKKRGGGFATSPFDEGSWGEECEPARLKKARYERYGVLYHTPEGKFDQ